MGRLLEEAHAQSFINSCIWLLFPFISLCRVLGELRFCLSAAFSQALLLSQSLHLRLRLPLALLCPEDGWRWACSQELGTSITAALASWLVSSSVSDATRRLHSRRPRRPEPARTGQVATTSKVSTDHSLENTWSANSVLKDKNGGSLACCKDFAPHDSLWNFRP